MILMEEKPLAGPAKPVEMGSRAAGPLSIGDDLI
jgi:hypothetical protein